MKKFNIIFGLWLILFALFTRSAFCDQKQVIESKIKRINTNISNKQYMYNLQEKKYAELKSQLDSLAMQASQIQKKLDANQKSLKKVLSDIDVLNQNIDELTKQLNKEKIKSIQEIKAYYYFQTIEKYFPKGLFYDYMNKKIAHYFEQRIKTFMQKQALLNQAKQQLMTKKNQQEKLIKKIDTQKNQLNLQKNKVAQLSTQAQRLKSAYLKDIAYLQRQKNYLQAVLNRIIAEEIKRQEELKRQAQLNRQRLLREKEAAQKQKLLQERASIEAQTKRQHLSNLSVGLRPPVEGVIVDSFGIHTNPIFNVTTRNDGIDIKATPGSAIKSIAKGMVDYVGNLPGLGGVVIINHLNGYYSIYAHVNPSVSKNHMVQEGQIIGRLSGDILHFELRKGSVPINPLIFINKKYLGG